MENKDMQYYLSLDKRTKEFKEWQANYKNSKGVGDVVADVTKLTGVQYIVKKLFGEDCGCDERQEALNSYFGKPVNPLTEDEYLFLHDLINGGSKITPKQQLRCKEIYENVFNVNMNGLCLSCSFVRKIYNPLVSLFNKYNESLK